MVATRLVVHYQPMFTVGAELLRTGLRLAMAYACWWLLKPLLLSRQPSVAQLKKPVVLAAMALFLLVPTLTGHWGLQNDLVVLFALTSFAVGLKEEFLFRGVIQNALIPRWGVTRSILLTSALFTLWHIGLVNPTAWNFISIFMGGIFLGVVYVRTGSLTLVVGLHAAYDALYVFTPLLARPYSHAAGFFILLYALALACYGASKAAGPKA